MGGLISDSGVQRFDTMSRPRRSASVTAVLARVELPSVAAENAVSSSRAP